MIEGKNQERVQRNSGDEYEPRTARRKFNLREPAKTVPEPTERGDFSEIFRDDPGDRLGKVKSSHFDPRKGTRIKKTWTDSPVVKWGFRIIGFTILAGLGLASYLMMRWLWPFGGLMIVYGFITLIAFWWLVILQINRAGRDDQGSSPRWISEWMAHFH